MYLELILNESIIFFLTWYHSPRLTEVFSSPSGLKFLFVPTILLCLYYGFGVAFFCDLIFLAIVDFPVFC